jgi:hypothetical protein
VPRVVRIVELDAAAVQTATLGLRVGADWSSLARHAATRRLLRPEHESAARQLHCQNQLALDSHSASSGFSTACGCFTAAASRVHSSLAVEMIKSTPWLVGFALLADDSGSTTPQLL